MNGANPPSHAQLERRSIAASGMAPAGTAQSFLAVIGAGRLPTDAWQWLQQVAEQANSAGQPELTAKTYLWTAWFNGGASLATLDLGDYLHFGLGPVTEAQYIAIQNAAFVAMPKLVPEKTVVRTVDGVVMGEAVQRLYQAEGGLWDQTREQLRDHHSRLTAELAEMAASRRG